MVRMGVEKMRKALILLLLCMLGGIFVLTACVNASGGELITVGQDPVSFHGHGIWVDGVKESDGTYSFTFQPQDYQTIAWTDNPNYTASPSGWNHVTLPHSGNVVIAKGNEKITFSVTVFFDSDRGDVMADSHGA